MGIISSTFLSLAVQLAWNCQRFLDPRYRYIEPKVSADESSTIMSCQITSNKHEKKSNDSKMTKHITVDGIIYNNLTDKKNKNRRVTQLKYRKRRRSSFDSALIARSINKNGIVSSANRRIVSSTPNTLTRHQTPIPNVSSSSSLSSLSSSTTSSLSSSIASSIEELNFDVIVKAEKMEMTKNKLENNIIQHDEYIDDNEKIYADGDENTMTAAEEAAFRMTIGRGHFSKSKKDKFLNNLRLEKQLYDHSRKIFEHACSNHSRSHY